MNVTLNADQRLYVIACGDGHSCLGFDNAHDHADQIAGRLEEPALAFGDGDHGTLQGYAKYRAAIEAWGHSRLREQTYFDPATDPQVARVLERCRRDRRTVRLMLGDTDTGRCWLDEFHVVGRIGRSTGTLKVPLLIEGGASGGVAILTSCVLRIVDWTSGRDLYRHPACQAPDLAIRRATEDPALPWEVLHAGAVAACFADIGKAGAYVAFMCGEVVDPRVFR